MLAALGLVGSKSNVIVLGTFTTKSTSSALFMSANDNMRYYDNSRYYDVRPRRVEDLFTACCRLCYAGCFWQCKLDFRLFISTVSLFRASPFMYIVFFLDAISQVNIFGCGYALVLFFTSNEFHLSFDILSTFSHHTLVKRQRSLICLQKTRQYRACSLRVYESFNMSAQESCLCTLAEAFVTFHVRSLCFV